MARVIGGVNNSTNYEVLVKKPFDARSLVPTYADLTDPSNWVKSGTTNQWIIYNGMLVAVADVTNTKYNGLYMFFDPTYLGALSTPHPDVEENWLKIGETSDISEFVQRLTTLESALESFNTRIEALENNDEKIHSCADFESFPKQGKDGHMYVDVHEQKTYVWANNTYLLVGQANAEVDIEEIIGGSAKTNNV